MSMTALSPSLDYQEGKTERSVIRELINNSGACVCVFNSNEKGTRCFDMEIIGYQHEQRIVHGIVMTKLTAEVCKHNKHTLGWGGVWGVVGLYYFVVMNYMSHEASVGLV